MTNSWEAVKLFGLCVCVREREMGVVGWMVYEIDMHCVHLNSHRHDDIRSRALKWDRERSSSIDASVRKWSI